MFDIAPDGPTALGYDSATIVIQAMRRSLDATPAAIRDEIEATQTYNGATSDNHKTSFNPLTKINLILCVHKKE